ncbi:MULTISPECIES: hypothetical protein [Planktothrix]|jgi:hypothetical protein|uniref:hypothetical protein n=1 Tax=Planktothrix TaxID=54304 RepID=UPI00130DABA0|nr:MULTISPECIES: hypothetical protein [Planktothrix]MCF3608132.1 hypothetical protein [Planktothrix agardhii 1033]MCP9294942.1 hypothetical protein [Planktothrix agardhii LY1]MDS1347969.1 hypothetical protein [Planktothrix agardhii NRERC-751]MEA5560184.1 hypothetical protein [Planktothrix agardhii UHCC 0887]
MSIRTRPYGLIDNHKIQECDRALEQLETPPIPPSPTRWQKIRRWFSQIKQFFRQLFS